LLYYLSLFFSTLLTPPNSTLFPYTTLFRSDNIHSLYVDQWDWELVIGEKDRNIAYLKQVVRRIYAAMLRTEYLVYELFPSITPRSEEHTSELQSRENLVCRLLLEKKKKKTI